MHILWHQKTKMISLICIKNLLQLLTLKHIKIRIVTILSHVLATQLQTIMDMKDTCKRRLVTIAIVLLQLVYL